MSEIGDYALRFAFVICVVGAAAGFVGGRHCLPKYQMRAVLSLLPVSA